MFPFYKEKTLKNDVKWKSQQATERQNCSGNSGWDLPSMDSPTLPSTEGMLGTDSGTCITSSPHLTTKDFLSPREDPGEETLRNN